MTRWAMVLVVLIGGCGGGSIDVESTVTSGPTDPPVVATTSSTTSTSTTLDSTTTTLPPTTTTTLVSTTASEEAGEPTVGGTTYESALDLVDTIADFDVCPEVQLEDLADLDNVELLGLVEFIVCGPFEITIHESSDLRVYASTWLSWYGCAIGGFEEIWYIYGPNWIWAYPDSWGESVQAVIAETAGGTAHSVSCEELLDGLTELVGNPEPPQRGTIETGDLRSLLGEN